MNSYSDSRRALVLKLGGELLESPAQRARVGAWAASVYGTRPLVIVHGGGRAIDAELARRQIAPRKVDGLRVTDEATRDAVVAVLAGSANTDLVAACVAVHLPAVGLTGVDAGFGRAARSRAHRTASGQTVDLGYVGDPARAEMTLIDVLLQHGYVPVVASLGIDAEDGSVLNVNADVMACRIAEGLEGADLVIAGGTAGVLDDRGRSISRLDVEGIDRLIREGTATAGMIAKLSSCRTALQGGVNAIRLIDGRALDASHGVDDAPGTTLIGSETAARTE
jgi:acetylglutamate kinase